MQRSLFLTTCARCGTHWVERLLWGTLGLHTCAGDYVGEGRHEELAANVARFEKDRPGGRLYVRHQPLTTLVPLADRLNVIALVRDQRDVLVSVAHYYVHLRGPKAPWVTLPGVKNRQDVHEVLAELLKHAYNAYWFDHYLKAREQIDHSLIRYEDMLVAPADTLGLALERCGIEYDPVRLAAAVDHWTFERLSGGRQPGQEVKRHHYRKGVAGEWRNYLTEAQNRDFFNRFRSYLEPFGYTLEGEC